jgi:hypothetical protein
VGEPLAAVACGGPKKDELGIFPSALVNLAFDSLNLNCLVTFTAYSFPIKMFFGFRNSEKKQTQDNFKMRTAIAELEHAETVKACARSCVPARMLFWTSLSAWRSCLDT